MHIYMICMYTIYMLTYTRPIYTVYRISVCMKTMSAASAIYTYIVLIGITYNVLWMI